MPKLQELIDPESVVDRATFANPTLLSDGIDPVIVDGTIRYRERHLTANRAGRFLRRESRA
jgi:N-acyl-D-amino-acid deacylase